MTDHTAGKRNMAYTSIEIDGRTIFLALHTKHAPSDEEWRGWTDLLEARSKDASWDLARTPNLVVTDGGAPNTAQRTTVNVLIAQAKTLPPVALVTASGFVRLMVRGFSIFNPRIRVFAPTDITAAVTHVSLERTHLPELLAQCARLEADVLGAGAIATLAAVRRMKP